MAQDHDETTAPQRDPSPEPSAQRAGDGDAEQSRVAQELLAEHVPLALLVDLVAPVVSSEEILKTEGLPEEQWWEVEPEAPSV